MKLHVIDNGIERVDKLFLIAGHGAATLRQPQPPHDWVDIPIQTFLVEHDGRRILFDTAVDLNWRETWPDRIKDTSPYIHTPEQYLPAALGRLGLAPEDIDTVVMSHLHADHAGCLHMFRNAAVYVSDRELTRTLRQYALREDMGIHIPADIAACLAAELRWRPVLDDEDELEVAPGVRILNFGPGHSWGMLGLWVSLPASGDFILVSDAIYMEECVRDGILPPTNIYDSLGWQRTVRRIRRLAEAHRATVVYGHDIEQFGRLVGNGPYE